MTLRPHNAFYFGNQMRLQAANIGQHKMQKIRINSLGIPKQYCEINKEFSNQLMKVILTFKCTVNGCNMVFNKQGNLKRHLRIHTGIEPFRC